MSRPDHNASIHRLSGMAQCQSKIQGGMNAAVAKTRETVSSNRNVFIIGYANRFVPRLSAALASDSHLEALKRSPGVVHRDKRFPHNGPVIAEQIDPGEIGMSGIALNRRGAQFGRARSPVLSI
jgi:hypothetical protein